MYHSYCSESLGITYSFYLGYIIIIDIGHTTFAPMFMIIIHHYFIDIFNDICLKGFPITSNM